MAAVVIGMTRNGAFRDRRYPVYSYPGTLTCNTKESCLLENKAAASDVQQNFAIQMEQTTEAH